MLILARIKWLCVQYDKGHTYHISVPHFRPWVIWIGGTGELWILKGWFGGGAISIAPQSELYAMTFLYFVAIRLKQVSARTVDYKAISSFLSSIKGYEDLKMECLLKVWIASMIERGLAVTSRKRYVEKLSSLYKEYCHGKNITDNSFDRIRNLCAFNVTVNSKTLMPELARIENIFDVIMSDAVSRPELAVFLYLLFNASSDLEGAISLTTDKYRPEYPQLEEIIKPEGFHHRRKYVFDLNQSRKRMARLVRDVTNAIESYFKVKGIWFPEPFTNNTIVALWMAKAQRCGIRLTDMDQLVCGLPDEYAHLRNVRNSKLTTSEVNKTRRCVAESFAPSIKKWYAIKLRRGVAYDTFVDFIKTVIPEYYDENLLFHPQKEISRKIEKRIVTKTVPVIPDVVFIFINPRHVRKVDSFIRTERLGYVFRGTSAPGSDYSVIAIHSMTVFQRMIGIFTPDIKIELTEMPPVGIGREVLITGGIMKGYEGTIYDIDYRSDVRHIYIRLSEKYSIKAEVKVKEFNVLPKSMSNINE